MTRSAGDRTTSAIAAITAGAVLATFVAGRAARDAILLEHFSVRVLPWMVGGSAVLALPFVLLVGRMLARHGPQRAMPALLVASAIGLGVEWAALRPAPHLAAIVLYLHLSTVGSVLVSGFWSLVTERFDARTARRHINHIGFGATLGGIAGGVIAERTGAYATTDTIVLVIAVLQLGSALGVGALGSGRTVTSSATAWSSLSSVANNRLLRTLAAVVMLGSIAASALDFELKAELAASGRDLLRVLAIYYTATSVLTAVVQLALGRDVIARFGVPRAIAALPLGVVATSVIALMVPALMATAFARGVELVTRSSIYRSAYELIYAPLAESHKRSTKVIVDVGADRIGDLVGAQLVALVLHVAAVPRPVLLALAILAGVGGLVCVHRLRGRYAEALEQSLLLGNDGPSPLPTMTSLAAPSTAARAEAPPVERVDTIAERARELGSGDVEITRRALEVPVPDELVGLAIPLLAWDAVAAEAAVALRDLAPRHTGALADALLDPRSSFAVRRRIPTVIGKGQAELAVWALWRGLADERFEVRYRSARGLARMRVAGVELSFAHADVFAAVSRELAHPLVEQRLLDRDGEDDHRTSHLLRHVFTVLGLALPTRPLDIALEAISTGDVALRATALEYLETVLPPELQVRLWQLLEPGEPRERPPLREDHSSARRVTI